MSFFKLGKFFLENEPIQSTSFSAPKGNVFSLSKEFSDHEKTVRSKMIVANIEGAKKLVNKFGKRTVFFGKINTDYSTHKNDFPENCLVYINQAFLTLKDRDTMIYCDYVILGQIIPFKYHLNLKILTSTLRMIKNLLRCICQCMTQLPESSWE